MVEDLAVLVVEGVVAPLKAGGGGVQWAYLVNLQENADSPSLYHTTKHLSNTYG